MTRSLPSELGRPLVIAHRGAKAYRPENTLPAYALAVEQGADMIEIDLHRSRDGAIPITHDEGLEGLGRDGEIAEVTLDQLRALAQAAPPAPDAPPEPYEHIPILEAVLDRFGDEIPFNLEIKMKKGGVPYDGLQQAALAHVLERGLLEQTLFSSFSDRVLEELHEREPAARLAVLVTPRAPERIFERARAVGAEAVNPHGILVSEDLVKRSHGEGFAVYPYTVDDEEQMQRLLELGVDGMFSNYPDRLRRIVDGFSQGKG